MKITVGVVKSQGVLSTKVSVKVIGWPLAIDGAQPAGEMGKWGCRLLKSIWTYGKNEMALRAGFKRTHMRVHARLFKSPSISVWHFD